MKDEQRIAHDDRTAHTVHRLEAFSDIVMGFCLAQLGVNLVMPKNAGDVVDVWASATFFIAAFIVIALLWWLHHRTFTTFFVLTTPTVIMNFGMLCALIVTLYLFESVMHVAAKGQDPSAFFMLFIVSFSVVYALLGAMLLFGIIARRRELAPADLRWGTSQIVSIALAILLSTGGSYLMMSLASHRVSISYVTLVLFAIVFLARRVILPWWLRRWIPDAPGARGASTG